MGALRKSSRSLSHLLMSSCMVSERRVLMQTIRGLLLILSRACRRARRMFSTGRGLHLPRNAPGTALTDDKTGNASWIRAGYIWRLTRWNLRPRRQLHSTTVTLSRQTAAAAITGELIIDVVLIFCKVNARSWRPSTLHQVVMKTYPPPLPPIRTSVRVIILFYEQFVRQLNILLLKRQKSGRNFS